MATVKTYDQRCYDLAMEFLKEESDLFSALHCHLLALEIQQCIEDEIYFMREKPELYPLLSKRISLDDESVEQLREEVSGQDPEAWFSDADRAAVDRIGVTCFKCDGAGCSHCGGAGRFEFTHALSSQHLGTENG